MLEIIWGCISRETDRGIRTISLYKLNAIVQLIAQPLKRLGSNAFHDRLILNFQQETI